MLALLPQRADWRSIRKSRHSFHHDSRAWKQGPAKRHCPGTIRRSGLKPNQAESSHGPARPGPARPKKAPDNGKTESPTIGAESICPGGNGFSAPTGPAAAGEQATDAETTGSSAAERWRRNRQRGKRIRGPGQMVCHDVSWPTSTGTAQFQVRVQSS